MQSSSWTRREFLQTALAVPALAHLRPVGYGGQARRPVQPAAGDPWQEAARIVARIKEPVFPRRDVDATRFKTINDAIDTCSAAGGGRVVVPAGSFTTGPIRLKSHVNLYLSQGAVLKFSTDPTDYLPLVFTRFEGTEVMNYSPFIYAYDQEDIAITGSGTLDGQADNAHWWDWTRSAAASRRRLTDPATARMPVTDRIFGEGSFLRPNFIQPYRCRNVFIEGITIHNSPMWEIHPVLSTNVLVRGVTINTHGPNNDGCNPESCRDVLIDRCSFDTGDDCIAIKSGRNADGRRLKAPAENIIVQGCRMKDGHGGITVGSEISGGVRNLFAENCRLDSQNLDHALRVKNNAMRGGLLESLHFRNIEVGQVAHAVITIDFNYEEGAKGNFVPVVRDYTVNNLRSTKSKHALDVQGLTRAPIVNLQLKNCTFDNVAEGNIVKNVKDATLENVKINGRVVDAIP
jgi:polygalacturonase